MYNWIDLAMLPAFLRGQAKAKKWVSLGEAWRDREGTGNCAIVRRDGRIVWERKGL